LDTYVRNPFFILNLKSRKVNDQPQSGRLAISAIGRNGKSTTVLLSVHLQPGAEHTVCMARNQGKSGQIAEVWRKFLQGLAKTLKKTGLPYN